MGRVIAGDYKDCFVERPAFGKLSIHAGAFKKVLINKSTVESYEIKNEGTQIARNRGRMFTADKYMVVINFKDGKRSLLEVNDKLLKEITKELF